MRATVHRLRIATSAEALTKQFTQDFWYELEFLAEQHVFIDARLLCHRRGTTPKKTSSGKTRTTKPSWTVTTTKTVHVHRFHQSSSDAINHRVHEERDERDLVRMRLSRMIDERLLDAVWSTLTWICHLESYERTLEPVPQIIGDAVITARHGVILPTDNWNVQGQKVMYWLLSLAVVKLGFSTVGGRGQEFRTHMRFETAAAMTEEGLMASHNAEWDKWKPFNDVWSSFGART